METASGFFRGQNQIALAFVVECTGTHPTEHGFDLTLRIQAGPLTFRHWVDALSLDLVCPEV
jgi:hypothetical protein